VGHRRQDHFARQAQAEHFPARSVYKLEEIDRRVRLVRPGQNVLDLGAAPGSWTLYLARAVGPQGAVLAVDLQELRTTLPANARFLRGSSDELLDAFVAAGPFDLVVSDMAPSTIGDRATDQFRSFELFCSAVTIAARVGRDGSAFVGKIFQGPSLEEARAKLRALYIDVRIVRPRATRTESHEVFLVGQGKKGGLPSPD
jgi:23S rRNA (uridine2552-2'-O)-methyltransferase